MGHREAALALDSRNSYKGGLRLLCYRVAEVVNDHHNREYWQSTASVASELKMDEGTVRKYMRRLVDDGWLVVVAEGGGRSRVTRYRWVADDVPTETAPGGAVCDPVPETAPGVRETAPGVPETAPGGAIPISNRKQNEQTSRNATKNAEPSWREFLDHHQFDASQPIEARPRFFALSADQRERLMKLDPVGPTDKHGALRLIDAHDSPIDSVQTDETDTSGAMPHTGTEHAGGGT